MSAEDSGSSGSSGSVPSSLGRPSYVHHVLEYPTETWCGKKVAIFALEFVFQNATHAIVNGKHKGHMLVCPECTEAMVKALRAGTWTEPSIQRVQVRGISATFEVQVRSNVTWILFSTPSRSSMVEFGDTLNAWLRSERLAKLFLAEGYVVSIDDFFPTKGHYRSSPYADCFRWQAYGTPVGGGPTVSFHSWETMTLCAKRGIVITRDDFTFDVSARGIER